MNLEREIMRAATGTAKEIKVAAADWAEACRAAHEGEWLDAAAEDCPDSDDAGWYPLVYRCAAGEWRGRMARSDLADARAYLSRIGRRGGAAGTGAAKRRGDPDHYRGLAARSHDCAP